MRRISLALALVGAVAATGCSGGAKRSSDTGEAPGVAEGTFTVTIQNGQGQPTGVLAITGGKVVSGTLAGTPAVFTPDGKIDCGVGGDPAKCVVSFPVDSTVLLRGVPATGNVFYGFAGDCTGTADCTLSGNADKYLVVGFGSQANRPGHANWTDPAVHAASMRDILRNAAGSFQCANCHGEKLQGQGMAPSCFASGCHTAGTLHDKVANVSGAYDTIPTDATGGPRVTAICITCHSPQAADFMGTQHWSWKGPTPQLYDIDALFQPSALLKNPGTIGKANLINNFCVSVSANERRCDQCHAGYGNPGTNVSAHSPTYANDATRVDCLICHAASVTGNMAGGGYNKIAGAFGAAGSAVGPGTPWATAAQLKAWSTAPQKPTRENCGWCHFNGGGADSVKIMSTALRNPAVTTDVHMSADAANGGQNMTCADCHADANHKIKGAGVHTPTNLARTDCSECHGSAPHTSAALNGHTNAIACQTCHIPAFARGMAQKIDWDWSTAGGKQLGTGGTIYACVSGTTEVAYDNNNCATAGGAKVKKYDFMKGTFAWGQNVKPTYRWYNGKMTHATTDDKGAFTVETGLTPAVVDRITLSSPLGARGNGKIFPFKVMTGRQAVYVDDAAGKSFVITPNLFHDPADGTDGGFWGVLAAQTPSTCHLYTYLGTIVPDAFGAPSAPLAGSFVLNQTSTPIAGCTTTFTGTAFGGYAVNPVGDQTTTYPIETLLAKNFTKGAIAAGQVPAGTPTFAKYDGTNPGWDWRYTKMYLDLEHEVAPAAQAIGAGGNCAACHGANPVIPICELYAGVPAADLPWGVTCP